MKRATIPYFTVCLTVLFSVLIGSLVWVMPAASQEGMSEPVRRALLIGIGKYEVLPRLPGTKNDIELVKQVLLTRYGFTEEHMRIVKDEAATREGVLAALHQLVQEAGPNDVVYIHYSGHGSQVKDLSGDEAGDQLDETIVPQDGRTTGVPDITDDELEEILSNLKTQSAVVVLDSCHSGTATRGLEIRVRAVSPDSRVALYKQPAVRSRAIVPLRMNRYILMSGAASNEEALDGPVDGKYHGFFTHSLFKSLQSASPDASTQEVFSGAKRELKRIQNQFGRTSMPEPQLEAKQERLRMPLFMVRGVQEKSLESNTQARRPWVEVQPQEKGRLILTNGVALGALPGSVWGIYPGGETVFDPGKAQAFAVVAKTQGNNAVARVEPRDVTIQDHARAILIAPAPQSGRISVRLRSVPSENQAWLKATLQKELGDVDIVGEGEFARFLVDIQGNQMRVYSADGDKEVLSLPMSREAGSVQPLSQVLIQSRNASNLLALENPASQIHLQVGVVQVGARGIAVVSDRMEAPTYRIRRSGEPRSLTNSLQLEVQTDTDCYITIVDVDAEGNVNMLFPNPYQNQNFYRDGLVPAGKTVLLPDSLRSGNRAGFHWDYSNPPGVDTIRVFASNDRQLTEKIRQVIRPRGNGNAGATQIVGQPVRQLVNLRQELLNSVTRGLITVPDQPASMAVRPAVQPQQAMVDPSSMGGSQGFPAVGESIQQGNPYPGQMAMGLPNANQSATLGHGQAGFEGSGLSQAQSTQVQYQAPDWTAASVTVVISQ